MVKHSMEDWKYILKDVGYAGDCYWWFILQMPDKLK